MMKALAVLLWPAGIAAILAVTALLAKRSGGPASAAAPMNGRHASDPAVSPRSARSSIIGLLLILAVGTVIVFVLMAPLGMLVVHWGPHIDKPVYTWTVQHRVHFWKWVMYRLTKVGDAWTTWGAAVTAAICLAAFYRKNKWLPPVALGAAIIVDHYLTAALRRAFQRIGPPGRPHGVFPSGACTDIILFYGLIAYLIWREASGSKRAAIWMCGVLAALGFSEAYSREYLTLHWFTDIISGLIYGALMLAAFVITIRLVDGPARQAGSERSADQVLAGQRSPARQ